MKLQPAGYFGKPKTGSQRYLLTGLLAVVLSVLHFWLIERGQEGFRAQFHHLMMESRAPAPEQFRPLPFLLAEILHSTTSLSLTSTYILLRLAFTWWSLVLMQEFAMRWLPASRALLASVLLAGLTATTFHSYSMKPGDPMFLALWILGLGAVCERRLAWVCLWGAVAMWVRETALFLVPAWAAVSSLDGQESPRPWHVSTAILTVILGVAYGLPRLLFQSARPYTELWRLGPNLAGGTPFLLSLLFLGALLWAAFHASSRLPLELRRLSWIIPPFVVLHLLIGVAWETRLYLPLFPLAILGIQAPKRQ